MTQHVMTYRICMNLSDKSQRRHAMTGIVYLINNEPEKGEAGLVEGVQQTVNCSMEQDVK